MIGRGAKGMMRAFCRGKEKGGLYKKGDSFNLVKGSRQLGLKIINGSRQGVFQPPDLICPLIGRECSLCVNWTRNVVNPQTGKECSLRASMKECCLSASKKIISITRRLQSKSSHPNICCQTKK